MTETIGGYLVRRLQEEGVGTVFGVPGDYVLGFFSQLEKSPLKVINTAGEEGAGFAADAYARINGLGVACITYCVGGLKIANAVAQAYAERSPVVLISGAPGTGERKRNPLLHHKIRDFDTQLHVFRELTVGTAVLDDADTAAAEIDRVLALTRKFSRPVYIEIPRDMAFAELAPHTRRTPAAEARDEDELGAAVAEAAAKIETSRHPVILAGEELHRFRLQREVIALAENSGVPVATTILGKSVLPESHPRYIGIYEGAMGREAVRDYVEKSDCIVLLGAMMTDMNLGIYTAHIDRGAAVYAATDRVAVGLHAYEDVMMEDFVRALAARQWPPRQAAPYEHPEHPPVRPPTEAAMTVAALFQQLNAFLEDDMIVIADPGDALFGASDLYIHDGAHFLGPAYYASLGFAIPAAIGVIAANSRLRPLVLVGDGSFQMSGMELATIARFGMAPIIVVFDNDGYGTERPMLDGAFNDIHRMEYAAFPAVMGRGLGIKVANEKEFAVALSRAHANTESFTIIQVMLRRDDHSAALERLTATLGARARGK